MPRVLHSWVTDQARRRPQAPAVVSGQTVVTYDELEARSSQFANALKEAGSRPGDRVAVLLPKSAEAVSALIGIYKAGAVYVPLDPSSPSKRLSTMLQLCGCRWLVGSSACRAALSELSSGEAITGCGTVWLDAEPAPDELAVAFTLSDVTRAPASPPDAVTTPGDPAHILFTSGSTGTPKGVVITHANVAHFVNWATEYFEMTGTDRVSLHPPLHFDLSFFDLFGAFAVGASVHLVPAGLNVLPNRLAEFIREHELTQWFSVPSVLAYLAQFDALRHSDFPSLRRVLWCGDVLATPVLQHWMSRLPHVTFTNLYGPTEATIASSYYRVSRPPADLRAAIPIGVACGGEELLVLDDGMRPVAPGTAGHLYIAGVGLARGYWKDPEQTAAAFLPHPWRPGERLYRTGDLARVDANGLTYFLGRTDSQIKSRGYRIELGEIEAALNTLAGVHESAVIAIASGGFEGAEICGAYVPHRGTDITPATLRRELQAIVPSYMLPSRWLLLDRLPRTANGKTDRHALRKMFEEDASVVAHSA